MNLLTAIISGQPEFIVVTTSAASSTTSTGATLNGNVTPLNAISTICQCEYSTAPNLLDATTVTASQSPISTTSPTNISASITGLSPLTTYYYRALAQNDDTAPSKIAGEIVSFTTLA